MSKGSWVFALLLVAANLGYGQQELSPSTADGPGTAPRVAAAPRLLRDGAYMPGDGVTAPRLVKPGPGHYSQEALDAGFAVTGLVMANVGPDGVPILVRAYPEFEKGLRAEAEGAVQQSLFEPGKLNGKPVAVHVMLAVSFRVEKGQPEIAVYEPGDKELADLRSAHAAYLSAHSGFGQHGAPSSALSGRSFPVPLNTVVPEFSEEARKAKYQGVVLVSCTVTEDGLPADIRVERGLQMGLNDKAIEAVRKYRFRPAMADGKPVAARVMVEVNFHLY